MKRASLAASVVIASCVTALVLSSTSQTIVTLPEDPYHFGNQMVMTPVVHTFSVSPATPSSDDMITSISYHTVACQDFTDMALNLPYEVCGISVSKSGCNASYQFDVTFTPKNPGMTSCVFDVSYYDASGSGSSGSGMGTDGIFVPPVFDNGGSGTSLHVDGSGVGPPYAMNVSPSSLPFGPWAVGTPSTSQGITVSNVGSNSIDVMQAIAPADYTNIPSTTFTLPPPPNLGASRVVSVTCTPSTTGMRNGSLTFSTIGAQGGISKPVTLFCQGVMTTLSESPNPIAFGDRYIGSAASQAITLSNAGSASASVSITSIKLGTGGSPDLSLVPANPTGFSIPPGGMNMPVTVHYSATTQAVPGPLGTLVVTADGSDLAYPISGGAETGSIASNPTTIDFGPVCIGGMVMRSLALYASGDADVTMIGVNNPAPPFAAVPGSGTLRGHHNGETTVMTSVAPTMASQLGDQMGELDITTDLPAPDTTYKVPLTAHVLPMGITPTPTEVHFGMVAVDTATSGKMVVLTNCSGSTLSVTASKIIDDPSEFVLVSTVDASGNPLTPPFDLDDHSSATFLVIMAPHSTGHKQAHLEIDYAGTTALVPLDGDSGASSDSQRETYYGCVVAGGSAVLPIVLALFVLRRRRRR